MNRSITTSLVSWRHPQTSSTKAIHHPLMKLDLLFRNLNCVTAWSDSMSTAKFFWTHSHIKSIVVSVINLSLEPTYTELLRCIHDHSCFNTASRSTLLSLSDKKTKILLVLKLRYRRRHQCIFFIGWNDPYVPHPVFLLLRYSLLGRRWSGLVLFLLDVSLFFSPSVSSSSSSRLLGKFQAKNKNPPIFRAGFSPTE